MLLSLSSLDLLALLPLGAVLLALLALAVLVAKLTGLIRWGWTATAGALLVLAGVAWGMLVIAGKISASV